MRGKRGPYEGKVKKKGGKGKKKGGKKGNRRKVRNKYSNIQGR